MKEEKTYGVVLNAVKFKLVYRMFAVVRRGTPFVELQTYKTEWTEVEVHFSPFSIYSNILLRKYLLGF